MRKLIWILLTACVALMVLAAQDFRLSITGENQPTIAIPDFRGSGAAQSWMGAFNQTLWNDISSSPVVKTIPKTSYPLQIPQQPSDFREPPPAVQAPRGRDPHALSAPPNGGGLWMSDWSNPPTSATYLAFGY